MADPISQVDRIFAIWQALHPQEYVVPRVNTYVIASYIPTSRTLLFGSGARAPDALSLSLSFFSVVRRIAYILRLLVLVHSLPAVEQWKMKTRH